jgi:hypothetical protein
MRCTETGQRIALFTNSRRLHTTSTTSQTALLALLLLLVPLITACSQETNTSDAPVFWSEPIRVATGNGVRGPWRMNRSNFQYVDDPNAHVTGDGQVAMTWVDQSRQDIFLQRYDQEGQPRFNTPVNVSGTPDVFSWFPDVIMTDDEPAHVYVLWQEIVFSGGSHGGEAFFARSTDGGRTFKEPVNLSQSQAGDGKGRLTEDIWHNGSLDLAIGPDGTLFAAWTEYEGRLWFRYSSDGGRTFSDPVRVAGGRNHRPARGPDLAVSSRNTVHVAWTVGERATADIRLRTLRPFSGERSPVRVVQETSGRSDAPKLTTGTANTLHLVYGEGPAERTGTDHVRYTRSTNGGRTFQPPDVLSASGSAPHERAGYPGLDVNGDTVVVTWEGFDRGRFRTQPVRLMIAVSRDGGTSFSTPALVPGTNAPETGFNGSQQGLLMGKVDLNRRNDLVVVNSSFIPNRRSTIQLIPGIVKP